MTKIDIVSGFLGAGKTTLINRLISEGYKGEKIVLIENEFGEIGIDGGFLNNAGIQIAEINSGCICCSLVGDFSKALKQVVSEFAPDRILIEPSGVGKLSDVTKAVISAELEDTELNSAVVVVDVNKCKMYMKNFGEFFNDQISNAGCIFFSHTDKTNEKKLSEALALVREHNSVATIVTTPYNSLDINTVISSMENKTVSIENELIEELENDICPECGHHHHHHHTHEHDHHEHCDHEHHEHHEHCCHDHEDHHHEHDHHKHCDHEHHDHHEHCCHEHDGHHEHHHHADEVFTSWGIETAKKYTREQILSALNKLSDDTKYGIILRAKGFVDSLDEKWIYFDYVPDEPDVREGIPAPIGKICVIGSHINEAAIKELFE